MNHDSRYPKQPPTNPVAEMALLGAILVNNRVYERVQEFLRPEHFADPRHAVLFDTIRAMINAGRTANVISLWAHVSEMDLENEAGGQAYMADLAQAVTNVQGAEEYAHEVYDCYLRRELIDYCFDVTERAYIGDIEIDGERQLELAEEALSRLRRRGGLGGAAGIALKDHLTTAYAQIEESYKHGKPVSALRTGLHKIDNKLVGGLRPGNLIIIAARPSMGKTALVTNIAFNVASSVNERHDESGHVISEPSTVAMFSLEMSGDELAVRLMAEHTGVSSEVLESGQATEEEMIRLFEVQQRLNETPLLIDDTPAISPTVLRARARSIKRERGLALLIVDYLQLMEPPDRARRYQGRTDEVTEISRALKAIAKELEVPVIALSQLSREVERRDDKRPRLSDLRESGAIEQDADQIFMMYRPEYYLAQEEPQKHDYEHNTVEYDQKWSEWSAKRAAAKNQTEVNIAKNRRGSTGMVRLWFDAERTRFLDEEPHDEPPPQDVQEVML